MVVVACSVEKDVFTARTYHRMVSKYNILFNGQQTLLGLEEQFRNGHEEDFQNLLPVFIVPDENAASAAKPDLERMIAKGTKVISRHSMMIRNEQKNNYIDDSYLLIGIARYYDRDYLKALETFNYIIQEFPHNHEARVAAELWAGRTETALENYLPAEDRFQAVYRDKHTPEDLKDDIFAAYAQLEIDRDRNTNAYQLITQAIDKADDRFQKLRWMYLAAQLQESLGNDYEASQLFAKVISSNPPYEYLFNAQLSRARSFDVDVQDPSLVYEDLEDMLDDEKNYDNRDKIYYVMAEVADKLEDQERVIYFLNRSVRTSTKNQEQKGLSYLWLAELNFDDRSYETAQAYYDSSYQNLPTDHPKYERVKGLVESLGSLVENLKTIRLQDSLQVLAQMSPAEREAVAERIVEEIKRKEEEEALAKQRAQMDQLALNNQGGGPAGLAGVGGPSAEGFYFYNSTVRSRGVSTFKQRWGNRKLEDNWRRKDKSTSAMVVGDESSDEGQLPGDSASAEAGGNPKYQAATYLKEVPLSPEALAASHEKIQNALFNNALLYKEQIIDFLAAAESLKEILKRYPDFAEKAKVYYFLYRVYETAENEALAEQYKQKVLSEFPESSYAYLILNDGEAEEGTDIAEIKALYEQVYAAFEQEAYRESLKKSAEGHKKYAQSEFGPKFALVKALSEGYLGRKEEFSNGLQQVMDQYPNTEQAQKASEILGQVNPGTAEGGGDKKGSAQKYQTDFSTNHRFVVIWPNKGRASGNDINIALTDFNRKYFPNDPLRSKAMLLGSDRQLVTVSGFPNKRKAMRYLNTLQNEKVLNDALISVENEQFVISNANFSVFYVDQDIAGYLSFFKEHYIK